MTAREVIDQIEQRAANATTGPWDMSGPLLLARTGKFDWRIVNTWSGLADDATFIAHARTDVPNLVAALRAVLDQHGDFLGSCKSCGNWSEGLQIGETAVAESVDYPCVTVRAITEALGGGA